MPEMKLEKTLFRFQTRMHKPFHGKLWISLSSKANIIHQKTKSIGKNIDV